jgi:two-component system, chemotaxis family, chemotaxis protein CheY
MSGYLRDISPHQRTPLARKILLADDSVTAQNMGRKILADAGYEVITVNNGSAALKKINEQRPDVIVLDVYMPGYSGLEVCQRLKETGDTSRIPILLTVGKLEPFKPEEAKRVRADGFIVKPFEASELLSALTKLEDKIVPRSETSKPGRFSRAIAAIDDPRLERSVPFDKTMAIEEDSSWKNRISFPAKGKKREAEVEEPVEQASKDLRSVIEKIPAEVPRPSATAEEKVDLSALAPAGLPKDVTPEEIAALAAAAARMKGKLPEPEMPVVAPPETQVQRAQEPFVESAQLIPTPEPLPPETKTEVKDELPTPNMAVEPLASESSERSEEGPLPESNRATSVDEPVTIAAAAAAASGGGPSRWMAVSVALTPEETGISLEQEMQKAYGVYEAAENGHSHSASFIPPAPERATAAASSEPAQEAVPVPAIKAPEEVQPLAAVANFATEAVTAAVKELETVATAFVHQETIAASQPEAPGRTAEIVTLEGSQPALDPLKSEATWTDALQPTTLDTSAVPARPIPDAEVVPAPTLSQAAAQETLSTTEPEQQIPETRPESTHAGSDPSADIAATEASWKHVPESDNDNGAAAETPQAAAWSPQDSAAMAAAVGGKSAVEELTAAMENDPAIASIVDSVLADLRPKIVEEISRKLGKKK